MDRSKRIAIIREAITKIAKTLTDNKVVVTQVGVKAFVKYDEMTMEPVRVNLPMLPDDASEELIDAVNGFLDGEISRVLYAHSPSALKAHHEKLDGIYKPIESLFCEKLMTERYTGSRHNLNNMHEEFVQRFIEPKLKEALANGADETELFQVLAVPALRAWGGQPFFKDYMSDKWSLIAGIQKQLDPLASKMSGMKEPQECYEMAKKIRNLVMGEPPEEEENESSGGGKGGGGGAGKGKGGGGAGMPDPSGGSGADEGEAPGDTESEQQESEQLDADKEVQQQSHEGVDYLTSFDWDKVQDISDEFGQFVTDLCSEETDKTPYTVYTREWDQLEPPHVPKSFDHKWMEEMEDEIRDMIGPVARQLERAFAARNRSLRQQGLRKGKLSAGNLYRLTIEDDRIFNRKIDHRTRDIAVSLVVDCSGSMSGSKIKTAMLAAWVLADVLQRLGVICEIMGFTTGDVSSKASRDLYDELRVEQGKGRSWDRVQPLRLPMFKRYDERFTNEVKKRIASYARVQGSMACNVDGESIQYAFESLNRNANAGGKKRGRMMIVFSDGQPAGGGCSGGKLNEHLKSVVEKIEADGVNIVGVGIQANCVQKFYRKNVSLDNIEELPGIVLGQLRDALLAS